MNFYVDFGTLNGEPVVTKPYKHGYQIIAFVERKAGTDVHIDDVYAVQEVKEPLIWIEISDEDFKKNHLLKKIFWHNSRVKVFVPENSLNEFYRLNVKKRGVDYIPEWVADEDAILRRWIEDGCPPEWELCPPPEGDE